MLFRAREGGHWRARYSLFKIAAQPLDPELSVLSFKPGSCVIFEWTNMDLPLNDSRNFAHVCKSWMIWVDRETHLFLLLIRPESERKQARPTGMIEAQKDRNPWTDSIRFLVDLLCTRSDRIMCFPFTIFSQGSRASILVQSSSIPRNSSTGFGPSTLSWAKGRLIEAAMDLNISRSRLPAARPSLIIK